tara:strand:- start:8568 stop:9473 length:906 start_codon:yes stop_codon:yes gene_type:complete
MNFISAELSYGFIEKTSLLNQDNERIIQIYYPKIIEINDDTKFIIINDGEELFSESDSWHGGAWNIDDSFLELTKQGIDLNLVVIAINSAKRNKGKIIDETRRYAEYFPNESIAYFEQGFKKNTYSYFIDRDELNYPKFLIENVIPFVEAKLNIELNQSNLGIIGASMGALSALNTVIEYPEYFGFLGCISTHWVGIMPSEYLLIPFRREVLISGDKETTLAIQKYVKTNLAKLKNKKIYFDHGTVGLDSLYGYPQKEIDEILESGEIIFQTKSFPGHDHETNFFGERFGPMVHYLLYSDK